MFFHRVLRSLKDENITVLASKDSKVSPDYEGRVVFGDFVSKETSGRIQKKEYTQAVLEIEKEYDVVVFNDNFLSTSKDLLPLVLDNLAHKSVIFQHDPDPIYLNSFHLLKYHLHCLMAERGSKILHVSSLLEESLEKNSKGFEKSPYKLRGYPLPQTLPSNFEHFDINEVEPRISSSEVTLGEHWVISGRSVPSKNLLFSIESFLVSKEKELRVFVKETTDKKDEYSEIEALCQAHSDRVKLFGNRPQSELFDSLLSAKGYIFSSKMESCGLAAFEAASCGCPVIYSVPDSRFFLGVWDKNSLVPRRVLSKYAQAIDSLEISLEEKVTAKKKMEKLWSSQSFKERVKRAIRVDG